MESNHPHPKTINFGLPQTGWSNNPLCGTHDRIPPGQVVSLEVNQCTRKTNQSVRPDEGSRLSRQDLGHERTHNPNSLDWGQGPDRSIDPLFFPMGEGGTESDLVKFRTESGKTTDHTGHLNPTHHDPSSYRPLLKRVSTDPRDFSRPTDSCPFRSVHTVIWTHRTDHHGGEGRAGRDSLHLPYDSHRKPFTKGHYLDFLFFTCPLMKETIP